MMPKEIKNKLVYKETDFYTELKRKTKRFYCVVRHFKDEPHVIKKQIVVIDRVKGTFTKKHFKKKGIQYTQNYVKRIEGSGRFRLEGLYLIVDEK